MLNDLKKMRCMMSQKLHELHFHIDAFKDNMKSISEDDKKFRQYVSEFMEPCG